TPCSPGRDGASGVYRRLDERDSVKLVGQPKRAEELPPPYRLPLNSWLRISLQESSCRGRSVDS
ncbi:MAG: hypothetical protein FGF53_10540, partial [Candidatus Brockarchaeota archaeon]|nr:hypothetical protein [Candidatus Brockarchaeota archaeon]